MTRNVGLTPTTPGVKAVRVGISADLSLLFAFSLRRMIIAAVKRLCHTPMFRIELKLIAVWRKGARM